MDLSFFRRAERRFARPTAAPPDWRLLVASLSARQIASPSARAEAVCADLPNVSEPLAELLLGGPRWKLAVVALKGSFNPSIARQRAVN